MGHSQRRSGARPATTKGRSRWARLLPTIVAAVLARPNRRRSSQRAESPRPRRDPRRAKAIFVPSGDHEGSESSSELEVSGTTERSDSEMRMTSRPDSFDGATEYTISSATGDHDGSASLSASSWIRLSDLASGARRTGHPVRCDWRRKPKRLPSGDQVARASFSRQPPGSRRLSTASHSRSTRRRRARGWCRVVS